MAIRRRPELEYDVNVAIIATNKRAKGRSRRRRLTVAHLEPTCETATCVAEVEFDKPALFGLGDCCDSPRGPGLRYMADLS